MCKECTVEPFPNRGTICYDGGTYFLNFKGCKICGDKTTLEIMEKTEDIDDEEESVKFKHVCSICKHLVADHEYTFRVENEYQEYEMSCLLCGAGEDSRSVLPIDPRKVSAASY